jgi:hypothetical protein
MRAIMTNAPESTQVWFATALTCPLLDTEETARAFAELILKRLHGEAELGKQRPLRIADEGADWVVTGSHQEQDRLPGTGAWFIRVRKSDCRVEKFGHYEPLEIPEEVKSFIADAKRRKEN